MAGRLSPGHAKRSGDVPVLLQREGVDAGDGWEALGGAHSSAMLVRDSARLRRNGASGRERQDSAGMRLLTAASRCRSRVRRSIALILRHAGRRRVESRVDRQRFAERLLSEFIFLSAAMNLAKHVIKVGIAAARSDRRLDSSL